MAIIQQLRDAITSNVLYPITKLNAVYDDSNNTLDTLLNGKQATLVSGTNIKTVNSTSLLGSGNIDITGSYLFDASAYPTTVPASVIAEIAAAHASGKMIYMKLSVNIFAPATINLSTTHISLFYMNEINISCKLVIQRSDGAIVTDEFIGLENTFNKVTSISSSSTNSQYPSAKCVYDLVGNVEAALQAIRGV